MAIEVYELPIALFFEPLWTIPFWFFALTATYPDEDETNEEERAALHRTWRKPLQALRVWLPYLLAAFILISVGPDGAFKNTAFSLVLFLTSIQALLTILRYARNKRANPANNNSQTA